MSNLLPWQVFSVRTITTARLLHLTLILMVMLTTASCGGDPNGAGGADADGRETIRIVPWGPRFIDFIDLYVGEENGYFAEAGIRVEQLAAEGAGDAVRNVIAGNADIAMADQFSGYFAITKGADLRGVYCPYTKNWMTLVVNKDKGINSPADLKGRTIAVTSQASTSRYNVMYLLAANGLTEDDVTMAAVGRDFASVLLGGTVDAASTWGSINWGMFRHVEDPREIGFEIWEYEQVPGPNAVYFTKPDWLDENRDLVQRFVTALDRSKRWIEQNPDQAAEIGSRHAVGADDLVRNRAIIDLRIEMQRTGPGVAEHGMGWCDIETMSEIANQAVELGILEKHIDIPNVITNEFIEAL
ncbi:MAG: ABC transporter substrate-binding protein [Woeseiaceae bacterium]